MKLNVALLAGGDSSEREVSLRSAQLMKQAFDEDKYRVWLIDVHGREWTYEDEHSVWHHVDRNDFSLTINDVKILLDYAFIVIHGAPGEDGQLQGYLEMMKIPYSTCDLVSTVVTFNKTLCKRVVEGVEGLHLARQVVVGKGEAYSPDMIAGELGLPLFVKPEASGSSFGVTKVKRKEDISAAVEEAFKEGDKVLIEEFVAGREFACGMLLTKRKSLALPVAEIISKKEFFDYEAKYTDGLCEEVVPARISEELTEQLQTIAMDAARACGCRGLVRVDFIVDDSGDAYMIEINSVPGMSAESIIPKEVEAAGMTMRGVVNMLIDDSIRR